MSSRKIKPTRWYYVVALLIPFLACLGSVMLVYRIVPELPGTVNSLSMKNLTQVVVPGSTDINFRESGAYAVYYEYRSVIDGVSYFGSEYPRGMKCQLTSHKTGETVWLAPSTVEGDIYTYSERAGVLFKRISINQPGVYEFSCQYPDGKSYPKVVMAVGPNLIWEFLNVAIKPLAAILSGAFVFIASCVISILIIIFVAVKRHQSRTSFDHE